MFTLFIVLHVIFCIFLILVILLQTGKGAGIGAAFGGGSQTVFGPRGAGSFIGKVTGVVAGLFMITSIVLAFLSTSRSDNVAKAVEALKSERATNVESVSLADGKDTVDSSAATAAPADTATGTDAEVQAASTDEASSDVAADTAPTKIDTAIGDDKAAAEKSSAPVGLEKSPEKPAKPAKPVGLKPAAPKTPNPKAESSAEPAAPAPKPAAVPTPESTPAPAAE